MDGFGLVYFFSIIKWNGQLKKRFLILSGQNGFFSSIFVFVKLKDVIQVMTFLALWQLDQKWVWAME